MVEGLSNSEMAARLFVSLPAVKSLVASILRKLAAATELRPSSSLSGARD